MITEAPDGGPATWREVAGLCCLTTLLTTCLNTLLTLCLITLLTS